jgi:hypothetical protein
MQSRHLAAMAAERLDLGLVTSGLLRLVEVTSGGLAVRVAAAVVTGLAPVTQAIGLGGVFVEVMRRQRAGA